MWHLAAGLLLTAALWLVAPEGVSLAYASVLIPILTSLIGAGGSIAGGLLGGGGDSGGPSPSVPVSQNPIAGVLANLFGVGALPDRGRGGIRFGLGNAQPIAGGRGALGDARTGPFPGGFFAERTFTPASFAAIGDTLDPFPLTNLELAAPQVGALAIPGLSETLEDVGTSTDILREIGATEFDFGPIEAARVRGFQDLTEDIAERFAGTTGTFSSDFLGAQERELSRLQTELGALEAQFQERNLDRRLRAAQTLPTISSLQTSLPLSVGQDLFSLGQRFRTAAELATPGFRALDVLSALANLSGTAGFLSFLPGSNPQGSQTANTISALGEGLPAILETIGGLLGPLGGGATSSVTGSATTGLAGGVGSELGNIIPTL